MADEPAARGPSARRRHLGSGGSGTRAGALAPTPAALAALVAALASPVPPGTGWPDDPATPTTPVAAEPGRRPALAAQRGHAGRAGRAGSRSAGPARGSSTGASRSRRSKRRSFAGERVLGTAGARLGRRAAAAAHRGPGPGRARRQPDRPDLHRRPQRRLAVRLSLAVRPGRQPTSVTAGDGQRLLGARMAAAVRCAPPANKPSVTERDTCAPWLDSGTRRSPRRACASSSASAISPGRRSGRSWPPPGWPCPGRGRRSATAPRSRLAAAARAGDSGGGSGSGSGDTLRHRLLPPEPAEHLYRPGHRGHAGRCVPAR